MYEIGSTVDRYIIEGEIGKGGLATVYKVRHKRLLTTHAMKVLFINRGPIVERLVLEGRIQANLRHPNIVHVSDVLDVDGAPVLLMDFVDGPTLKEWLANNQPSVSHAVFLFTKVVEGMAHAHAHGMIHRDLKPDNIMLDPDPTGWTPKLMDFGLAKLLSDGQSIGNTRAGATMGTPEFMSPEQVRDSADVDERADIFSLGCIFYQLLTGKSPFRSENIVEIFNAITKSDPPKPSTIESHIPDSLDSIVMHMLAKERDDRPANCRLILQTLSEASRTLDEAPAQPPVVLDPTNVPSGRAVGPRSVSAVSLVGQDLGGTSVVPTEANSGQPRSIPPPWAGSLPVEEEDAGSLTFFMPGEPEAKQEQEDELPDWPTSGSHKKRDAAIVLSIICTLLAVTFWSTDSTDESLPVTAPSTVVPETVAPAVVTESANAKAKDLPDEGANVPAEASPAPVPVAAKPPPVSAKTTSTKASKKPVKRKAPKASPSTEKGAEAATRLTKVTVTGDARTVWLTNSGGMFPVPGDVPPGNYKIKAWFSSATPVIAGEKTITGTPNSTVNCNSFMERCK